MLLIRFMTASFFNIIVSFHETTLVLVAHLSILTDDLDRLRVMDMEHRAILLTEVGRLRSGHVESSNFSENLLSEDSDCFSAVDPLNERVVQLLMLSDNELKKMASDMEVDISTINAGDKLVLARKIATHKSGTNYSSKQATLNRHRPKSWKTRGKTTDRPPWDKRFNAWDGFDVDKLLKTRNDGSFYVTLKPNTEDALLHVAHCGDILRYDIYEAESELDGTVGYSISGQPNIVYRTMTELVESLKRDRGPLPVQLQEHRSGSQLALSIHNRKSEEPWCWWQLDTPKSEAEAILDHKNAGAFVVYRHQTNSNSYILAYKAGSSIYRELIYHTPPTDLFQQGFHLAKAQHRVMRTLQQLIEYHTAHTCELLCRLRVSIPPPESREVKYNARPVGKRPPGLSLSWFQVCNDR